jgi:dihydroorotate dehydrogenase
LDKNGVAVPAFAALGFAYVEVGTVVPKPQPGNSKPRVFRLTEDAALINRMGFPSLGAERAIQNLATAAPRTFALNVGPNKERVEHASDECLEVIARARDLKPLYTVINVSSPNTQKLRTLQGKDALRQLLADVLAGRPNGSEFSPLLVKIAPDLTDAELDDLLQVVTDLKLDGIVSTNTSVARPAGLQSKFAAEAGGLSGRPIAELSTRMISRIHQQTSGALTIIAAGGVYDGIGALDKIGAGATVVQTYTGLIYEGPGMAKRVKQHIAAILDRQRITSLDQIRGTGYRAMRG